MNELSIDKQGTHQKDITATESLAWMNKDSLSHLHTQHA